MSESTESSPAGPVKVLLVDDQPLLRMGFRLILEGEDDLAVVGEASDGAEALRLTARLRPGRGADGRADAGAGRDRGHPADRRAGLPTPR